LKAEVEAIDKEVELGKMTKQEGDAAKTKIAEERAKNIETKTAEYELELRNLITNQVQTIDKDTTTNVNNINLKIKAKKTIQINLKTELPANLFSQQDITT